MGSGKQEHLQGYEYEVHNKFYEKNYKWDKLIQNIFADDEIVDRLVQKAQDNQSLRDSLEELLMFFSHKDAYNSMKKEVVKTIVSLYPITASEASSNIIMIPRDQSFAELSFDVGSTLVAVSYCIKSFECPKGRFSIECNENCNLCDMSRLKRASAEMGFDFRIATDDDRFIEFLEDSEWKYTSLITIVCPYTTNKIGYAIHKVFGLRGVVIPLRGDVCTSEDKYMKGVKGEKSKQTKTDLATFFNVMGKIKRQ